MKNIFSKTNRRDLQKGTALITLLIVTSIALITTVAFVNWGTVLFRSSRHLEQFEKAYHAAEAGIEYYRWHLAHSPNDYRDGTNSTENGPFTHDFLNVDGDKIGEFDLYIEEPTTDQPFIRIRSVGRNLETPPTEREIVVDIAYPSLINYAIASNSNIRVGAGTEVFGPFHSNGGIYMDGTAYNLVSSSLETYDDPDHTGPYEWAVHTHANGGDTDYPNDPSDPEDHPEIFRAGREFQAPTIDFNGITSDLASMKTTAIDSGHYYPPSNGQGWEIILKTDGTFDIYQVSSTMNPPAGCTQPPPSTQYQTGWGTWSINNKTFYENRAYPDDGLIFFEDNVWVSGSIDGVRLTVVAAQFPDVPSQRKNIIVNSDVTYANGNELSANERLGLIAQNNFIIGFYSEEDLEIDAAVIAQNGRVGRYYYDPDTAKCGATDSVKDVITLFGSIISNQRYGFAYTNNTGYLTRVINYDNRMFYGPPPYFPTLLNEYAIIRWDEEI
jgi:hypothetical protein